jgi:hypothetical protein
LPAIKLNAFGGELPAWSDKLLPDGQAARSINTYAFTGELQGWRQPTFLRALQNGAAQYIYGIPYTTFNAEGNAVFDTSITGNRTWLEFGDIDTTVVRSQIPNDQYQRYYFAAPTLGPPQYNTLQRIQAGRTAFQLGIPQPAVGTSTDAAAPIVSVTGGGNIAQIGPQTSTGGTTTVNANTVYLLPIVPSGAANLVSISVMPETTNAAVRIAGTIYQDATIGGNVATKPGAYLSATPVTVGITATTLLTLTFSNPVALDGTTPYWIGITMDTTETMALGDGQNNSGYFVNTFSNGLPSNAPSLFVTGQPDLQMYGNLTNDAVVETRAYTYTYISAYGEEGPPSTPTVLTGYNNAVWTIKTFLPPSNYYGGTGLGNIAVIRIYRTVTGSTGTTSYFQVQDLSIGSTDPDAVAFVSSDALGTVPWASTGFVDTFPDNSVALDLTFDNQNNFPPPANMQQIFLLPNGMYAGYFGNTVCFSMPYLPHAWPPGFQYTVDYPIVGMAITQGSLVAVTDGVPWTFIGTQPSSMSQVRAAYSQPCQERGSIVGTDIGVFYKSINGLIQISSTGALTNYTETWITREKWNAETPASGTRAIPLLGSYFAFGAGSTDGFTVELDTDNASFTIWPQPGGHRIGFNQLEAPNDLTITNCILDPWTGIGLTIQEDGVYYYDFTQQIYTMQTYDWTSKIYQQNTKRSFNAFKVWFKNPNGLPVPGTPNTTEPWDPSWQTLSPTAWLYVLIYADVQDENGDGAMKLVSTREVQRSGQLHRVLDGWKAENFQFRLIGRVPVSNMQIATSARELANV